MGKTFLINYEVSLNDGSIIKDKEIKVKNKVSELQAKISLEYYLKTRYQNFKSLIITNCHEELIFGGFSGKDDIFGEIIEIFNGFSKKSN